jgi:hypothetical protein
MKVNKISVVWAKVVATGFSIAKSQKNGNAILAKYSLLTSAILKRNRRN